MGEEQQGKNMCVLIRCMDVFVISCMELRGLERLFVISVQHVSHRLAGISAAGGIGAAGGVGARRHMCSGHRPAGISAAGGVGDPQA